MSIFSSTNIISRSLWLLLLTLGSLHLQEIAGQITNDEYSSESVIEEYEDPLKNTNSESLGDFRQGHRHFKRHHREELPTGHINMPIGPQHFHLPMDFPRSRHHLFQQMRNKDSQGKENIRISRVGGPMDEETTRTLPSRFSFVAQQFYQYVWEKRNNAKKDIRETEQESDKNPGDVQEPEENTWNEDAGNEADEEEENYQKEAFTTVSPNSDPKPPPFLWRNIIDAPSCPSGQRKDANGRCRVALW